MILCISGPLDSVIVAEPTCELCLIQHGPQAPSVPSVCDSLITITPFAVNHHPTMTPGIHFKTKLEFAVTKLALEGNMSVFYVREFTQGQLML